MLNRSLALALFAGLLVAAGSSAAQPPGEVIDVEWCPGATDCLQWTAAGSATEYQLYRGAAESLPCLLTPADDSCHGGSFAAPPTGPVLTADPAPGRFSWYLV